ncbi:MAG: hypothetical protein WCJ09_16100 [Planctomycetota bacterium]
MSDQRVSFPDTEPSDPVPGGIYLPSDSNHPEVQRGFNRLNGHAPLLGIVSLVEEGDEEDEGGDGDEQDGPTSGRFIWKVEDGAARNYRLLGQRLAESGDLYRNKEDGHGLIQVLATGKARLITKGTQLAPVIVDRVRMRVEKEGNLVSELPTSAHLNAMLFSEEFLGQFIPVDEVTKTPFFLDDFSLVKPGFNDGGRGNRVLYVGDAQTSSPSLKTLERFLEVMPFSTNADRTNFVAAGLTVPLRRHWPGEKPLVLITSTRSHSGKGTLTECLRGSIPKADILYESLDWPMQSQFQRQLQSEADIGVVVFDNVRLDSSGGRAKCIRSAFLESFLTNAEVTLASPTAGEPLRLSNRFVVTLNSNEGMLSIDLMNRSLPIHLAPTSDVHEKETVIGNPKLEFLPKFGRQIEAEFRGMIEKWKAAGSPLDNSVRHPMSNWAKTIGGILKVNGFTDFLANYGSRKSADDPVRGALAILGAAQPGEALRPDAWANLAVTLGLSKTLFSPNERDTPKGRERNIGVILTQHLQVTFDAQTDTTVYRLRLEGGFRRWEPGQNPHTRYRFDVLSETEKPEDITGQQDKGQ